MLEGLSEDALNRMQRQILTLDPDKSIWRGGPGEISLPFPQCAWYPLRVATSVCFTSYFRNADPQGGARAGHDRPALES